MFKGLALKISGLISLTIILSACSPPEKYFDDAIKDEGYIPYETPLASAGVGTMLKGRADAMRAIAHPRRCFPDHVGEQPTHLRWVTDTVLPDSYKKFTIGFGSGLAQLLLSGNPLLGLNLNYSYIQTVSIEFDGATVEYLDEISFKRHYRSNLDKDCKQFLKKFPFITQALRIERMKFKFISARGLKVDLNPGNIDDIVDIGPDVDWSVVKRHTLVIKSPKYIGFQVGKMGKKDNGNISYHANRVDGEGRYKWEKVGQGTFSVQSLDFKNARPAEPLSEIPRGLR